MAHMNNAQYVTNSATSICRIHFIHLFGTYNVGDEFCGPEFYFKDYFKNYDQYVHDLREVDFNAISQDDVVIFGGGGLFDFDDTWNDTIEKCIHKCKYSVIWGAGQNQERDKTAVKSPVIYSRFDLIGVRDYQTDLPYVPCVSCMMTLLSKQYAVKRRIGIIQHKKFPINEFLDYPKMSNETEDIRTLITFIGESEIIVTNTYHVWYWATLMNKKVVLYEKISTKFDRLRYKPVMYSGNLDADISRCVTHPDALREAIELNHEFAKRVISLLNS